MMKKPIVCASLIATLTICVSHAIADDRNLLPKYGSLPKEAWQKESDDVFIASVDKDYHGDHKKASNDFAMRGWQYLSAGDPDTAMRRFNQAWLLNDKNGIAIWGMGAVEADLEKFDESLKLFAEAEKLVGDDTNFSIDYSRVISVAGLKKHDQALVDDAFDRFAQIYKKHPQETRNLKNWAQALFEVGNYSDAWAKVKLAENTPNKKLLDPRFIEQLQAKMPRPRG